MASPLLFLSHAGSDSDAALKLAAQIEATPEAVRAGLKVWVDKRSLRPGISWQQQLEDAIEQHSTAFAIYLSDAGAEHWVRTEVRAALDRVIADGREGRVYPFIPILAGAAEDIARLPLFARQYQGVNLNSSTALVELVATATFATALKHPPLVTEPFLGLESFSHRHAHLFFGRDRETKELLDRLRTMPLLIVVGDSGSGKSSLVKAGVIPAFREGVLSDPVAPRPGPGAWHVVEMRPGRDPIQSFIDAVANAAREVSGLNAQLLDAAFGRLRGASGIQGDPGAAIDMLREGAQVGACCLLVVDQFEELWSQTLDDRLRSRFVEVLMNLVRVGNSRCRVIATMRRDYVFQLTSIASLCDHLKVSPHEGRYNLRRMSEVQLRECVEKPLALAGVAPDQTKLLVDEVLRDAGDEPGQLAMLEMALFKTWEERSAHPTLLDAYKGIGRIEGALSGAADQSLARLREQFPRGGEAAETIFVRLVTQSANGTVVRRTAHRDEFQPDIWKVAQALGTSEFNRLVVLRLRDEDTLSSTPLASTSDAVTSAQSLGTALTVELAHEQIATQWDQYRLWLKREAVVEEDKRALDRLILRASDWNDQGRRFWEATTSRLERISFDGLLRRRPQWTSRAERAFVRSARLRVWVPIAAFVAIAMLAGTGVWLMVEAQRTDEIAVMLWNRLPLADQLSERDVQTISKLAAADSDIKMKFAEKLRGDSALAERFLRQPRMLTFALAGGTPQLRSALTERVVLGTTQGLGPEQLQAIALLGVELHVAAEEPLLQAIKATSDPRALLALARGLQAVHAKLDPAQAERAVEPLLRAIGATSNPYEMRALALGLQALPAKLDPAQAERAVEPLLQAIKRQSDRGTLTVIDSIEDGLEPLAEGLLAVASTLYSAQAERVVEQLRQTIEVRRNPIALDVLAQGLQAVASKLDPAQAERAVEPLLKAIETTSDPHARVALMRGLQAVPSKLDQAQAARAVDPLLNAIKRTGDDDSLGVLAKGLLVASKLNPTRAESAVEPLLKAINEISSSYARGAMAQGLKAVAVKLDPAQAQRAVGKRLANTG